jgi:flagellar biosynthesis GTPase FlhF
MDAKLTKSLTDLIDETLQELDELRKSRFSAAEIKIEGPGDGIAGKPSDGALDAKKAEDDKDDEKEEKESKAEEKAEEAKKGENEAAKAEDMDKKEDKDEEKDEEHPDKKETKEKAKDIEEDAKEIKKLHKSIEESESLMKSYVEERVKPLEQKLSTILDLVNKIAEQPVAPKGVTAKTTPLFKSADEGGGEPLSKAEVANKLFELKKSGTRVDSLDIAKAEMGQDLATIVKKYEIS